MANTRIDMRQIRQIIRLYTEGTSKQLGISRNTVKKYLSLFEKHRLTYEDLSELDELFENRSESLQSAHFQDLNYSYISKLRMFPQ